MWCTNKLTPIYIINPYLDTDAGDLYCISYSASLQTVYFGCQNTSLQWFDFSTLQSRRDRSGRISSPEPLDLREADIARKTRSTKRDKFFRDGPNSGSATPTRLNTADLPKPLSVLRVQGSNVIDSAHYGYIYSMALLPCPSERQSALDSDEEGSVDSDHLLVTGSGDETVRVSSSCALLNFSIQRWFFTDLAMHFFWTCLIPHLRCGCRCRFISRRT